MFKQVYRFLSIMIISNLLLNSAALSQPQKTENNSKASTGVSQNKVKAKRTFIEILFGIKKPVEQKADDQKPIDIKPDIKKPVYDGPGYVTKYGVYFSDDIYDTYPQIQPNKDN